MMRYLHWIVPFVLWSASLVAQELPDLRVSDNGRFLVTENNEPFFWLGETAWELFHRLNREEAIVYLDQRAKQGFNVIQAVVLAEMNGLNEPNCYNHRPLINNDATRPWVVDGPNNDYWTMWIFIVNEANKGRLYVGLLPLGRQMEQKVGDWT